MIELQVSFLRFIHSTYHVCFTTISYISKSQLILNASPLAPSIAGPQIGKIHSFHSITLKSIWFPITLTEFIYFVSASAACKESYTRGKKNAHRRLFAPVNPLKEKCEEAKWKPENKPQNIRLGFATGSQVHISMCSPLAQTQIHS